MTYYDELMKKSTKPCEPNHYVNHRYTVFENIFSPSECELVLEEFKKYETIIGGVGKPQIENDVHSKYTNVIDPVLRYCRVTYIDRTQENLWIHSRIEDCIKKANDQYWQCQITDYSQPMRLMSYGKGEHFGSWHQDNGVGDTSFRKLTAILQVSNEADYDGGKFEICGNGDLTENAYKQGSVVVFPCYLLHRVTEVTRGTRHSVVHRAIGEPFR